MPLIFRFGTSFLLGVTGLWFLFPVYLAIVELDIGPVGAHVEFLYEELIVGPVVPVLDFCFEVVVEYPLVLGVLYIRLQLCLGGSGCGSLRMLKVLAWHMFCNGIIIFLSLMANSNIIKSN